MPGTDFTAYPKLPNLPLHGPTQGLGEEGVWQADTHGQQGVGQHDGDRAKTKGKAHCHGVLWVGSSGQSCGCSEAWSFPGVWGSSDQLGWERRMWHPNVCVWGGHVCLNLMLTCVNFVQSDKTLAIRLPQR